MSEGTERFTEIDKHQPGRKSFLLHLGTNRSHLSQAITSMLVNAGPSLPAKSQNVTRKAEKNLERANQRPRAKAYSGFHKQIVRNAQPANSDEEAYKEAKVYEYLFPRA